MNRVHIIDSIIRKLTWLSQYIETRGSINLLDSHVLSEDFYTHLFNLMFDWDLKNLNEVVQNAPGIDLVEVKKKIIVQVSATAAKRKVDAALSKVSDKFKGYSFKFLSISKDASDLRDKDFINPHKLVFEPKLDIFDIPGLIKIMQGFDIDKLRNIDELLSKELLAEPDPTKMESNLSSVIKVLFQSNLNAKSKVIQTTAFKIDKKIEHNKLKRARPIIEDYKVHSNRLRKIYEDFDEQGVNKSLSVLNGIQRIYLEIDDKLSPDDCFFEVIRAVGKQVLASKNCPDLTMEEISLSVSVVVVDAFIRCKMFKNPEKV